MDSACKYQQGNCDEVENSARPFCLFLALWLNLCNNSDQTLASVFKVSLGTWQTLMHEKTCLIPIFKNGCQLRQETKVSVRLF